MAENLINPFYLLKWRKFAEITPLNGQMRRLRGCFLFVIYSSHKTKKVISWKQAQNRHFRKIALKLP